jgi:hypothetical protein
MGEEVQGKLDFYIQPRFSVIIGASVSNGLRERKPPMKSSMYVIKWIGAVCLITACLCPVFTGDYGARSTRAVAEKPNSKISDSLSSNE